MDQYIIRIRILFPFSSFSLALLILIIFINTRRLPTSHWILQPLKKNLLSVLLHILCYEIINLVQIWTWLENYLFVLTRMCLGFSLTWCIRWWCLDMSTVSLCGHKHTLDCWEFALNPTASATVTLPLLFHFCPYPHTIPLIYSPYTTFAVYWDASSLYEHLIPGQGG